MERWDLYQNCCTYSLQLRSRVYTGLTIRFLDAILHLIAPILRDIHVLLYVRALRVFIVFRYIKVRIMFYAYKQSLPVVVVFSFERSYRHEQCRMLMAPYHTCISAYLYIGVLLHSSRSLYRLSYVCVHRRCRWCWFHYNMASSRDILKLFCIG